MKKTYEKFAFATITSFLISFVFIISGCSYQENSDQLHQQSGTGESFDSGSVIKNKMSFFVTSTGSGDGANLGGLDGADLICQKLAESAGVGDKTWHAYLSTQGSGSINAKDRIGNGPWYNAKGDLIANDIEDLHSNNKISKQFSLTETGGIVNGRGDTPNNHDILTGTQPDGTAFSTGSDVTCGNWTLDGSGSAMLGHSDRMGLDDSDAAKSWNSSHLSRGCSQTDLRTTGGAGLLYCFAE